MKPFVAKAAFFLVLAAQFSSPIKGQTTDESAARSKLLALENAWNQAESFKDLKALEVLFDDRLVYVDFDGALLTKAGFLSRVRSAHLQQVVTESVSAEIFGSTAVVTGTYHSSEFKGGRSVVRRGRFVDVWVFKKRNWLCVSAQSTPALN